MPRKGPAVHREAEPDPVYQNVLVTQLINKILLDGKKTLAERTVYKALEIISERTANDPVIALKKAVENVRPQLEVRSRRVGGAERRRAGVADHRRELREAGLEAAVQVAGGARPPVEQLDHVADGRRVVAAEQFQVGGRDRAGGRHGGPGGG